MLVVNISVLKIDVEVGLLIIKGDSNVMVIIVNVNIYVVKGDEIYILIFEKYGDMVEFISKFNNGSLLFYSGLFFYIDLIVFVFSNFKLDIDDDLGDIVICVM